MSKDFGITKNGLSDWHYLWIVPLYVVIIILALMFALFIFAVLVALSVSVIAIGSAIVALPVWWIWGAVFPATMTYFEWFGAITCIRLIFAPMFNRKLTEQIKKYSNDISKELTFIYEKK